MQKTAQKRSLLNQLREKANIPGAMIEGFFKPELDRIMNDLRMKDDNIRTILTGQKIGKAEVNFTPGASIKELVKSARRNFNRREYMAGVADLGQFHKRMFEVKKYIKELELSVARIHHNFLFQHLTPKQREHIEGLESHMSAVPEATADLQIDNFIKRAGLVDFLHNIVDKRGRALAIWEKKYPNVAKDLREGGNRLIDAADSILADTLSLLREMATYRATRSVDNYLESAKKIVKCFDRFDAGDRGFRSFYEKTVKPYLITQKQIEKEQGSSTPEQAPAPTATVPDPGAMGAQPVASPAEETPVTERSGPPSMQEDPEAFLVNQKPATPPANVPAQLGPTPDKLAPVAPAPNPQLPLPGIAHSKFMESLESMSGEDPRILASYIAKYARSVQSSDPETALKLFEVARKIKE
jgi:hypothetical protein